MTRPPGRQPIYPWAAMHPSDVIIYPVETPRAARNLRRNVSQYSVRSDKGFRCRIDRSTTPPTIQVTRVR